VNERIRVLRQLVTDGMYVVEDRTVADAIRVRAQLRRMVAEPQFRSDRRGPMARSFRRDRDARSFRLAGG
jgi:hypothetical protein